MRIAGKIARLVNAKGFGFITPAAGGAEAFFHRSSLRDGLLFEDLREGQPITFEDEPNPPKGRRASQVFAA
jgi:cold shock CspA family protein